LSSEGLIEGLKLRLDSCSDGEPRRETEAGGEEDEEAAVSNKEFEKHRKAHYNEFQMAQLMRKQLEEEDEMEEKRADSMGKRGWVLAGDEV